MDGTISRTSHDAPTGICFSITIHFPFNRAGATHQTFCKKMKTFSRHMPKLLKGTYAESALAYGVIALFLAAVAWLCFTKPVALVIVSLIIIYSVVATIKDNKRLRTIAAEREKDNICTFARAFDRRTIDPWTIRAAYDELQGYFGSKGRPFPIRASDRFKEDLKMDGDDLFDLIISIAERSRHNIAFLDKNPQIQTIDDLVTCISNLPVIEEAEQAAASNGDKRP